MLTITKKTDYALIALAYLAEQSGEGASARQIAVARGLPLPLLMRILKNLHHHRLLGSRRGVMGGYRLEADLESVSLCELIEIMECRGPAGECGCGCGTGQKSKAERLSRQHAPVQALQFKMQQFLRDVKLSDLILPGRRIDVPYEQVAAERARPVSAEWQSSVSV